MNKRCEDCDSALGRWDEVMQARSGDYDDRESAERQEMAAFCEREAHERTKALVASLRAAMPEAKLLLEIAARVRGCYLLDAMYLIARARDIEALPKEEPK